MWHRIIICVLWTIFPVMAMAQADPDWSRREMERMQAQQERFDAQVERLRSQQERIDAQQEREAMRRERRRVEQEHEARLDRRNGPSIVREEGALNEADTESYLPSVTLDRIGAVFEMAVKICRDQTGNSLNEAGTVLPFNEFMLLVYYCNMYDKGSE